jgi:hypothetical protein
MVPLCPPFGIRVVLAREIIILAVLAVKGEFYEWEWYRNCLARKVSG